MLKFLTIYNNNSINKYGMRATVGALVDSYWHLCETQGVPSFISHDQSRPIGWVTPNSVFFEPSMVESTAIVRMPETLEEKSNVENMRNNWLLALMAKKQNVLQQLSQGLAPHFKGTEKIIHTPTVAYIEDNLAVRAFPKIFEIAKHDRDGLIPLSELDAIGSGVFKVDEFIIFAHPYFRRRLFRLNTLNPNFLQVFQKLSQKLNPRIKLDTDMIGLATDYKEPMELTYVWGPEFKDDITSISPGVTVYEANQKDIFWYGISRTEFWWKSRKGAHEFEVEELPDVEIPNIEGIRSFGARYIHSIVPPDKGTIQHFDGAVREYNEVEIIDRLDKQINKAGKHAKYTKLWRVDGEVDIKTWKYLVSAYFRENTLIGEYLGGEDNNNYVITSDISSSVSKDVDISDYVPYSIEAGMGVRVAIHFSIPDDTQYFDKYKQSLVPISRISMEDHTFEYIELEALEIWKLLKQSNPDIYLSPDVKIIEFEDNYINFPIIFHTGDNIKDEIDNTKNSIRKLVDYWVKQGRDIVLSFHIGFVLEDKNVYLSFLGHYTDILDWLNSPNANIPTESFSILVKWAEGLALFLQSKYENKYDIPSIKSILTDSGLLSIQRISIDFPYKTTVNKDNEILITLNIPKDNLELLTLVKSGKIRPALVTMTDTTICSNCNSEYRYCDCSKILHGATEFVNQIVPLTPIWTNRHISY